MMEKNVLEMAHKMLYVKNTTKQIVYMSISIGWSLTNIKGIKLLYFFYQWAPTSL